LGVVEGSCAFPAFLEGPRGCVLSVFAKVELRCLPAAAIAGFEFGQDGREVIVALGVKPKP